MSLRRRGEKRASDARILGDGEFVERILEQWDEVGRMNFRVTGERKSLTLLAHGVCENYGVTVEELRSGSRREMVLTSLHYQTVGAVFAELLLFLFFQDAEGFAG